MNIFNGIINIKINVKFKFIENNVNFVYFENIE